MQITLASLRALAGKKPFLRKLVAHYAVSTGLLDSYVRNYRLPVKWVERLNDILASEDNLFIPRVQNAGAIAGGKQTMHNGIKIHLGSYYGPEIAVILNKNKGVHEPQEERVFAEVLSRLPENATMVEMGSFWSFYSMWFNKQIKNARNFMVEPDRFNLEQGMRNFRLNGMAGTFIHAFIGDTLNQQGQVPVYTVDGLVENYHIDHVHILHSDIQGAEYEMLKGASQSFYAGKVDYVFISTHSNNIHLKCATFLEEMDFKFLACADLDETFSVDGLIVAVAPHVKNQEPVKISRKTKAPQK